MEGDQEVAKRSGRDEPMWIAIHKYMEAKLEISMYSYLYLKLAKMLSFLLCLMFSLQQNWRTRGWNRFCQEAGGGEEIQKMYSHVSKCNSDLKKKKGWTNRVSF
jgi:hypothetical protein